MRVHAKDDFRVLENNELADLVIHAGIGATLGEVVGKNLTG